MFRRHITLVFSLLVIVCSVTGCNTSVEETNTLDGIYVYEKDGFGSEFIITLNEDGTFQYSEGALSSTLGYGTWTLEDDILCISEEDYSPTRTNYFQVKDGNLVFVTDHSDNFLYIKVADGEQFTGGKS